MDLILNGHQGFCFGTMESFRRTSETWRVGGVGLSKEKNSHKQLCVLKQLLQPIQFCTPCQILLTQFENAYCGVQEKNDIGGEAGKKTLSKLNSERHLHILITISKQSINIRSLDFILHLLSIQWPNMKKRIMCVWIKDACTLEGAKADGDVPAEQEIPVLFQK